MGAAAAVREAESEADAERGGRGMSMKAAIYAQQRVEAALWQMSDPRRTVETQGGLRAWEVAAREAERAWRGEAR